MPPGRCSEPNIPFCIQSNSSSEPFIVAHNILLSQASAASLYKEKFKVPESFVFGYCTEIIKRVAIGRIRTFTQDESNQVKDSLDFVGLNHYSILYFVDDQNNNPGVIRISLKGFKKLFLRMQVIYLAYLHSFYSWFCLTRTSVLPASFSAGLSDDELRDRIRGFKTFQGIFMFRAWLYIVLVLALYCACIVLYMILDW